MDGRGGPSLPPVEGWRATSPSERKTALFPRRDLPVAVVDEVTDLVTWRAWQARRRGSRGCPCASTRRSAAKAKVQRRLRGPLPGNGSLALEKLPLLSGSCRLVVRGAYFVAGRHRYDSRAGCVDRDWESRYRFVTAGSDAREEHVEWARCFVGAGTAIRVGADMQHVAVRGRTGASF